MSIRKIEFKASNISKRFGSIVACSNISLRLDGGKTTAVVGENGSGKSTLVSIIAGIQAAERGSMYLNGSQYIPKNYTDGMRSGIGIVTQESNLLENLTVAENALLCKGGKRWRNSIMKIRSRLFLERNHDTGLRMR